MHFITGFHQMATGILQQRRNRAHCLGSHHRVPYALTMKRLKLLSWKHVVALLVSLALATGLIAGVLIHLETSESVGAARAQSLDAASGFASAAEEYFGTQAAEGVIRVSARQSFDRIVEGILLGTARYVQVVLGDAVIVDAIDREWQSAIPLLVTGQLTASDSTDIHALEGQLLVDVVVPIGTPHPEAPEGTSSYARVGYEVPGLASHLRSIRLAGGGIALASFIVACFVLIASLCWLDYQRILITPFHGIVGSLASMAPNGPLVLDEHAKQITLHGQAVYMPPKPFQLLALLIREDGRVLQESEIVSTLWPTADLADSRDVRQCVYLLRKRLDAAVDGAGACVANVKGFGYRFDCTCLDGLPRERELVAAEIGAETRG